MYSLVKVKPWIHGFAGKSFLTTTSTFVSDLSNIRDAYTKRKGALIVLKRKGKGTFSSES